MTEENKMEFDKRIDERIKKLIPEILKSSAFTKRKLTDTPTDDLMTVNRKYVNLNGTTALRPSSSVASARMKYFDTTIGRPIYYNPNSSVWTDGAGSIS